jgi:hypothetical protein
MNHGIQQNYQYAAAGSQPARRLSVVGCGVAEIRDEDLGKREESLVTTVNNTILTRLGSWLLWSAVFVATLAVAPSAHAQSCPGEGITITANVVVFDNPTVFNRLGAQNPNWITYALERDVVHSSGPNSGEVCGQPAACKAGNVRLRPDKRPRPLVIRSVEDGCLTVNFTNLLAGPGQGSGDPLSGANPNNPIQDNLDNNDQVAGRCAGFNASGTELISSMLDDGSMVGRNHHGDDVDSNCSGANQKGGMVGPDGSITYNLYTPHEGQ